MQECLMNIFPYNIQCIQVRQKGRVYRKRELYFGIQKLDAQPLWSPLWEIKSVSPFPLNPSVSSSQALLKWTKKICLLPQLNAAGTCWTQLIK